MKPTFLSALLVLSLVGALGATPASHELPGDDGAATASSESPAPAATPDSTAVTAQPDGGLPDSQMPATPQIEAPPADADHAGPAGVVPGFRHSPPESAYTGVTLTLDVFSPTPIQAGGAMVRRVGDAEFKPFPFSKLEDNYYTIDIPAEAVSAPGIEYYLYVEQAGVRHIVWASPINPVRVVVEGGINTGKELERYRYSHALRGFGESYHFPAAGGKLDTTVNEYEVEYTHRFFGPIYSVRYGQGLYQTRELNTLSPSAKTYEQEPGFFYSFLEADLSPPDSKLTLALKGMGGAMQGQTGAGYEARLSYGDELGMNVSVGARSIENMGNAGNLNMRVRPLPWLSLGLGGEVGDMPDNATLDFREYLDAEFQLNPQLKLLLRGGSAAYNIQQIDGDFGGGLTYEF